MIRSFLYLRSVSLCLLLIAPLAQADTVLFEIRPAPDAVLFQLTGSRLPDYGTSLTVTGPEEYSYTQVFQPGEPLEFYTANLAADGQYNYELRLLSPVAERVGNTLPDERVTPSLPRQSGVLTFVAGALVAADIEEPTASTRGGGTQLTSQRLCVGQDCLPDETFDFDDIRLKENNVRIRFVDTSNSASFPSADWELSANETTNGGNNQFSIDDLDAGTEPFVVEAGAGNDALFVSRSGRIGLGTGTPLTDLHTTNGNTPTFRLDQDGTGGFAAQIWDMGGNETEWFVRNTTDFQVPFRIRPNAPTNSLSIGMEGNVGLGTFSPAADLHLRETLVGPAVKLENIGANNREWDTGLLDSTGDYSIDDADTGATELVISAGGDVTIAGTLISNSQPQLPNQVLLNGTSMTLAQLQNYISAHGQLPGIGQGQAQPPAQSGNGSASLKSDSRAISPGISPPIVPTNQSHDVVAFQLQLLEKIQELTLHTIAQQQQIEALQQQLDRQQ